MVYQWKIDKYPVSAQIAGETIETLKQSLGKDYIEAEDLLEASRDINAPLHSCFEWDDDKAAEKYRLWQAKDIINHIAVVVESAPDNQQTVRAFVSIANANDKGKYVDFKTAMTNDDYKTQVLHNALWELQNFKRKYQTLVELDDVFNSIDKFADSVEFADSKKKAANDDGNTNDFVDMPF